MLMYVPHSEPPSADLDRGRVREHTRIQSMRRPTWQLLGRSSKLNLQHMLNLISRGREPAGQSVSMASQRLIAASCLNAAYIFGSYPARNGDHLAPIHRLPTIWPVASNVSKWPVLAGWRSALPDPLQTFASLAVSDCLEAEAVVRSCRGVSRPSETAVRISHIEVSIWLEAVATGCLKPDVSCRSQRCFRSIKTAEHDQKGGAC